MAKPFTALRDPRLGLDDVLPFGRHQGYTVEEVLKDRPEYIRWLIVNTSTRFHDSIITRAAELSIPKSKQYQYNAEYHKYSGKSYDFVIYDELFDDMPF